MKKSIIFIFSIIISNVGLAKQERSSICESRIPVITIDQAIRLTALSHGNSGNKSKEIFVDEAKLQCINNKLSWLIGYRLKAYESGHMYVSVKMDGTVKLQSIVKDG